MDSCPITDVTLEESVENRDLYEVRQLGDKKIYFSKKVLAHPIQEIKLRPTKPCLDPQRYGFVAS